MPTIMVLLALILGWALPALEHGWGLESSERPRWITSVSPEGARALLTTVAGSTITVTGVVFSITIVALTLASTQFGPWMLRNFMRDRGNQLVMGVFIATFIYSLVGVHDKK